MKFSNALSKLERCGYNYKVDSLTSNQTLVKAKKDIYSIGLMFEDGNLTDVTYVGKDGLTQSSPNLTRALKVLGDVKVHTRSSKENATPESIIKMFVGGKILPKDWKSILCVKNDSEMTEAFERTFHEIFRYRRRYSHKIENKKREISRMSSQLFKKFCEEFLDEGGIPLYTVSVTVEIENTEVIFNKWGEQVKNEARMKSIPVFARSSDEAVRNVSSIIGPLGSVSYERLSVLDFSRERALEIFYKSNKEGGSWNEEKRFIEETQKNITDLESRIENSKKSIQLSNKKIEIFKTLEALISTEHMG